jgi:hypothetical protein
MHTISLCCVRKESLVLRTTQEYVRVVEKTKNYSTLISRFTQTRYFSILNFMYQVPLPRARAHARARLEIFSDVINIKK